MATAVAALVTVIAAPASANLVPTPFIEEGVLRFLPVKVPVWLAWELGAIIVETGVLLLLGLGILRTLGVATGANVVSAVVSTLLAPPTAPSTALAPTGFVVLITEVLVALVLIRQLPSLLTASVILWANALSFAILCVLLVTVQWPQVEGGVVLLIVPVTAGWAAVLLRRAAESMRPGV
ncbi:MAG: hypothetical protein JSV65_11660 [Armatimonadota bacterium]|nr:MAG: hypothetical protein JSV65_11660 [Armatimonadota bacterium]